MVFCGFVAVERQRGRQTKKMFPRSCPLNWVLEGQNLLRREVLGKKFQAEEKECERDTAAWKTMMPLETLHSGRN